MERNEILQLDNTELNRICKRETYRVSGPGGQHRNKTESAIEFYCLQYPNIKASATERRSQEENKRVALQRLRIKIALEIREKATPWTGQWNISEHNPLFPLFIAILCDALEEYKYSIHETANFLGISTGQLIHQLKRFPTLWQQVNQKRIKLNLHVLR